MNGNATFEENLKILNSKQLEAVDTIDGPVMVIAGPGTGKTQILTLRIANILKKTDTPADSILALTFTEAAAANMRRRLVSIIGSKGYYVTISTFHGFCNKLIQDYPEHYQELIGGKNASEVDRISIIRSIIDKNDLKQLKPFGEKYFYVRDILFALKNLKNEGVSEKAFLELCRKELKKFEQNENKFHKTGAHTGKLKGEYQQIQKDILKNLELANIYIEYQKILRATKLYDFEDMVLETIAAFEKNEGFLREIQEKFQYLLVDEHQDTNGSQNRILELICSYYSNPNLFIVGDEKQAIFRFQGANLDNFLYFQKKYPTARLINLEENYRSTQAILDSAQSLIEKNKTTIFAPLHSNNRNVGQKIHIVSFETAEGERLFIVNEIKSLLQAGVNPRQVAILYRENRDALPISSLLEKNSIPFSLESDLSVLDDIDIRKLNHVFSIIKEFGNDAELIEAFHIDFFGVDPLDLYRLTVAKDKEKLSVHQIIERSDILDGLELENPSRVKDTYKLFKKWHVQSRNLDFLKFFEQVLNESGFLTQLIGKEGFSGKLDKLNALFNEIKKVVENHRDYKLSDYLEYLRILEAHGVLIQAKATSGREAVRLMTAHRAKGLEFENVFIIRAVDGHWGNKKKSTKFKLPIETAVNIAEVEKNEDERRLFYMALTRAKLRIFITYSQKDENDRDQIPSQFLEEIKPDLKEYIPGQKFDEIFLNNKAQIHITNPKSPKNFKDLDFVEKTFRRRGLNVSALNNYLSCPWKYFYLNLLRIPRTPSKHQIFGIAVHYALKTFFDLKRNGHEAGEEEILSSFRRSLEKQIIGKVEFDEILNKGENILSKYFLAYKDIWNFNTLNEVSISGVDFNGIKLTGKIDKIELNDGESFVTVVDYKTKQPDSRNQILGLTKNSNGDYKRQLVFYKLLLDLKPEQTWDMRSGVIDFIEPNERGIFKKEAFEIEAGEIEELKEIIQKTAEEILTLAFWDRRCLDKTCRYCALRELMQ